MRRKWSPWPAATRKFQVAVKPVKLEVLPPDGGGDDDPEMTTKFVAIKIKWKGEPKLFPLMAPRSIKELSGEKFLERGWGIIRWDEDHWFENTCCFSVVSDQHDQKFGAWEIAFNVIYGEKMDSKAKMGVIGRVSMNISEIACKMEKSSSVEQTLPLSLQVNGFAKEATLTVVFNFVEIREPQDSVTITRVGSAMSSKESKENQKARRRSLSQEEVSLDESDESGTFEAKETSLSTKSRLLESDKKEGWFSWKGRRFSFKRAKTKEEKLDEKEESCSDENTIERAVSSSVDEPALQKDDPTKPSSGSDNQDNSPGSWEEKELISRDGQAKLKAQVFFASFDQRSDKAAGESACTALVAVISHWLHANSPDMPDRSELDNLIIQGSAEWRKLCEDATYVSDFPNKHFDLETVLRADIRPVSISHNKSFVGFFGAESFESLKGAMSFGDIWNEISSNNVDGDFVPRIYIVSWNDHFFVLKAEANAYYIIDTLGERLFEGCRQAYILRFDENTLMQKQKTCQKKAEALENENDNKEEEEEIICSGTECCREFIKRFLAAIPLKELEEEEKKKAVSYFSLHHRLQIEFNYSCFSSSPPSSSSISSPLSSLVNSTPSPFSE